MTNSLFWFIFSLLDSGETCCWRNCFVLLLLEISEIIIIKKQHEPLERKELVSSYLILMSSETVGSGL